MAGRVVLNTTIITTNRHLFIKAVWTGTIITITEEEVGNTLNIQSAEIKSTGGIIAVGMTTGSPRSIEA